jgi:hypothetical protein
VPITICVNKTVDSLYVIQVFLKVEIEFMLSSSRLFFFFFCHGKEQNPARTEEASGKNYFVAVPLHFTRNLNRKLNGKSPLGFSMLEINYNSNSDLFWALGDHIPERWSECGHHLSLGHHTPARLRGG